MLNSHSNSLSGDTTGSNGLNITSRASSAAQRSDNSLIPLINIIFLLLIFYMIAGQISYSDGAVIDVPVSASDKQLTPPELQLSINTTGVITLNGTPLDSNNLDTSISEALGPYPDRAITIKADKNVRASQLNDLLMALKNGGVTNIALFSTARENN